jgi:hypothetical protein
MAGTSVCYSTASSGSPHFTKALKDQFRILAGYPEKLPLFMQRLVALQDIRDRNFFHAWLGHPTEPRATHTPSDIHVAELG